MSHELNRVDKRDKLKPRRDPYWLMLSRGRYVGFRRMSRGKPGTWLCKYYDVEKERKDQTQKYKGYQQKALGDFADLPKAGRYDAAKVAAEEWFQHLDLGGAAKPETVRAACEAYVKHLEQENSQAAARDATGRFERLVYKDPIGRVKLDQLKKSQVSGWRARVLALKQSKGSFNRNATALRAALNLALERDAVASNRAWAEKLKPFKDADGRREVYLTVAQRRKLIENATPELQPLLRGLALLPIRPGDAAKLRVSDFDPKQAVLTIPAGKTKTRKIPLSGEMLALIRRQSKDKLPGAWLFARADGRKWDRFAWRDQIKDAVRAANQPAAICAYTFRHSAITDLVKSGLDLFHVAQLAGTSVAVIEKHYGHLSREEVRKGLGVLSLK